MHQMLIIGFLLFLTACGSGRDPRYTGFDFPYKPDMHQGNIVKAEDLAKLQLGMSKLQVEELIGAPILTDDFNNNHWLYVQLDKVKGGKLQGKKFSVYFEGDKLKGIKK